MVVWPDVFGLEFVFSERFAFAAISPIFFFVGVSFAVREIVIGVRSKKGQRTQ
jgi:hypothetical protein